MNDGHLAGFDPAVIAIDGLVAADLGVLEIYRLLFIDEELDIVFERALIALQGENVIGFLVDDRLCNFALAAHRVDGHDRSLDRQHAQQLGNGDDLVGFFSHRDLTENETLARGESRHDVDRTLGVHLLLGGLRAGPAPGLAVDRDQFGRNSGQRRDPGDKATPERLGVERGQDVAQVVVRRRSVLEGSEASEKGQLVPAEPGYIRDRLRPGDDGEQAQQQNLIERIFDLAALPNVRQISEIAQEDDCFAKRPDFLGRSLHRNPPIGKSVDIDNSALNQIVQNFFARSPCSPPRST